MNRRNYRNVRRPSWSTILIFVLLILIFLMGFGIVNFGGGRALDSDDSAPSEVSAAGLQELESVPAEQMAGSDNPQNMEALTPVSRQSSAYTLDEQQNIFVYESCNEAVVNITTEEVGYNWFLEAVPREGSSGSGSIIDSRGYILTNNHVVEKAYKVHVVLADGVQFDGEVIGSDPENDLAVIQINPGEHELLTIPFGTSGNLRVGQKVLAIGNPFAFERTLTTGIISGLGRPLRNDRGIVIQDLIQTDASINPGNSGGPLLDTGGRLVGVNTMIYSPSGGSVGIGFAVPVDTARRVVPDLIEHGFVQRGWIQIEPVQLFPSLVRFAELPVSQGILVSRVLDRGNAEKAGLRGGSREKAVRSGSSVIYLGGDIITGINGEQVATLGDLYAALEKSRPGDVVNVSILRGRRQMTLPVTLAERPRKSR